MDQTAKPDLEKSKDPLHEKRENHEKNAKQSNEAFIRLLSKIQLYSYSSHPPEENADANWRKLIQLIYQNASPELLPMFLAAILIHTDHSPQIIQIIKEEQ